MEAYNNEISLKLNIYTPEEMNRKIDRQMMNNIFKQHCKCYIGQGVPVISEEIANELHKPVHKHFKKRRVISKHVEKIWAAD